MVNEIASNFEYEGWSVTGKGENALLLEREGKTYRVTVTEQLAA
jgi:hypothetical protein